jgi:hypothetical protein
MAPKVMEWKKAAGANILVVRECMASQAVAGNHMAKTRTKCTEILEVADNLIAATLVHKKGGEVKDVVMTRKDMVPVECMVENAVVTVVESIVRKVCMAVPEKEVSIIGVEQKECMVIVVEEAGANHQQKVMEILVMKTADDQRVIMDLKTIMAIVDVHGVGNHRARMEMQDVANVNHGIQMFMTPMATEENKGAVKTGVTKMTETEGNSLAGNHLMKTLDTRKLQEEEVKEAATGVVVRPKLAADQVLERIQKKQAVPGIKRNMAKSTWC